LSENPLRRRPVAITALLAALFLGEIGRSLPSAVAQPPDPAAAPEPLATHSAAAPAPPVATGQAAPLPSGVSPSQEEKSDALRDLELRLALLEKDIGAYKLFMEIIATVFAVGSLASLFSMFRFEQRASDAHRISIPGESAAQKRASDVHSTFLEGPKTTLELVNATLTLAQGAGERAARFLENKARSTLLELDTEARDLLTRVDRKDDRALIADEGRRNIAKPSSKNQPIRDQPLLLASRSPLDSFCTFYSRNGIPP
jgi:hypothetical protein